MIVLSLLKEAEIKKMFSSVFWCRPELSVMNRYHWFHRNSNQA